MAEIGQLYIVIHVNVVLVGKINIGKCSLFCIILIGIEGPSPYRFHFYAQILKNNLQILH